MESKIKKSDASFAAIIELIETLRGENGCPWDKQQSPRTIVRYLIEEAYELMDAIHSGGPEDICEELGDVLFLVLFIALQLQETGAFKLEEMLQMNLAKMIRRHPHVFGKATAHTTEEVKQRWRRIKLAEKEGHPASASILGSVPQQLPALMRCYRISERAARTGFDWRDTAGVMQKAEEEWHEFKKELEKDAKTADADARVMEFGDVLFTLVNVARLADIHPEEALALATKKFETRFKTMEKLAHSRRRSFDSLSFEEMHVLWDEVKKGS